MVLTDTVPLQVRSRIMASVRGKNTQPELLLRRHLHQAGYRYRLHAKNLPGKPDLVFPRLCAILFVNGCFWHGHDCYRFSWPKTRESFWREKILGNMERDKRNQQELALLGWRVGIVWGCALQGKYKLGINETTEKCIRWLESSTKTFSIVNSSQAKM